MKKKDENEIKIFCVISSILDNCIRLSEKNLTLQNANGQNKQDVERMDLRPQ